MALKAKKGRSTGEVGTDSAELRGPDVAFVQRFGDGAALQAASNRRSQSNSTSGSRAGSCSKA